LFIFLYYKFIKVYLKLTRERVKFLTFKGLVPTLSLSKEGKWFKKDDFLHLDENELVHPDMQLVYNIAVENKGLALECVKSIDYSVQ